MRKEATIKKDIKKLERCTKKELIKIILLERNKLTFWIIIILIICGYIGILFSIYIIN